MMRVILIVWALFFIFTPPAIADSWRTVKNSQDFGTGAIGCRTGGHQGNMACLQVGCKSGGPLQLMTSVYGGDFGQGEPMPVYFKVDGKNFGAITMTPTNTVGLLQAGEVYDPKQHAAFVNALAAGREVSLSFWNRDHYTSISLSGSSRAISFAKKQCSVVKPSGIADPLAHTIPDIAGVCENGYFKGVYTSPADLYESEKYLERSDLNGDGLTDITIFPEELLTKQNCATAGQASSLYLNICIGAGPNHGKCAREIYLQNPDGTYTYDGSQLY